MKLTKPRLASTVSFNMTPMIDIVFLLIIFFMSVSQITRVTDQPLLLPRVSESEAATRTATVTLNLNAEGEMWVAGQRWSLTQLVTAMRKQLQNVSGDPDRVHVQLRCDRNCECQHVNQVIKRLSKLGFKKIRSAVTEH